MGAEAVKLNENEYDFASLVFSYIALVAGWISF